MTFRKQALCLLAAAVLTPQTVRAEAKKNTAATPSPRLNKEGKPDPNWMKRHEGFVGIAKKGDVPVVFLGDSITDRWRIKDGKSTWDKEFAPLDAVNFGIGGDRTEHVLWRVQNGELDRIKPRVAVVMIGTNNIGANNAAQIAEGVRTIVKAIHAKSPQTKVLLLGVFPRGATPQENLRTITNNINKVLSKLDGQDNVRYMDIGPKFLDSDGMLTREVMPDLVHLSARGYQIWGDAIAPTVRAMAAAKE